MVSWRRQRRRQRRRRSQDRVSGIIRLGLGVGAERWGEHEVGTLNLRKVGELGIACRRLGCRRNGHRRRELDPGGRIIGRCRVDALFRRRCGEPKSGIFPGQIGEASVRRRRQAGLSFRLRYGGGGGRRRRRNPFRLYERSRLVCAGPGLERRRQGSQVSKSARRRRLLRLVPCAPALADDNAVGLFAGRAREKGIADPALNAVFFALLSPPPAHFLPLLAGQTKSAGVERRERSRRLLRLGCSCTERGRGRGRRRRRE